MYGVIGVGNHSHIMTTKTSDIIVSKLDNTNLKIECSEAIAYELRDYFTFKAPNYQFHPLYRKHKWAGNIRLFNVRSQTLYVGLLNYLEEFAKDNNYSIEIPSNILLANNISLHEINKWIISLKLQAGGKPIEVREHQLKSIAHILRNKRTLLLNPTGSGKSLILYLLCRFLYKHKILLIVPTTNLILQMFKDFCDYSTENGWDVDVNIHPIYEGQEKGSDKRIYLSTWQSIYQMPKEYFEQFDTVICDEAHIAQAKCIKTILEKSTRARYRVGVTGSLDGTQCHKLVLEGLLGPLYNPVKTKELIERQELANFEIKCLSLVYPETEKAATHGLQYQNEIEYLINNPYRNKFISNLALSLQTNTLILYRYVAKHGQLLYEKILEDNKDCNRKIFFISGQTDMEVRDEIRSICDRETNAICVASIGTFSTGVNIPNLHNIILANPMKGKIKILQSIGRGLRLHPTKEKATLFDISDDLSYNGRDNWSLKHVRERIKIFTEEQFPYKIYQIQLKGI